MQLLRELAWSNTKDTAAHPFQGVRRRLFLSPELSLFPHSSDQLTPRQKDVVQNAKFFEPYKKELRQLFHTLHREEEWSEDPREMIPYLRQKWIGTEHGASPDKDQFNPEEIAAAMPILEKIGLMDELLPQEGKHYDNIVIAGGTTIANYGLIRFTLGLMKNRDVTADTIILLFGERKRNGRDGTNDELLHPDGPFAGNDLRYHPWVCSELSSDKERDTVPFATETELGRLTLMKLLPQGHMLQPYMLRDESTFHDGSKESHLRTRRHSNPTTPRITDYYFYADIDTPTGRKKQKLVILNAAAVPRDQGKPRPTTKSQTVEWLDRHDIPPNANILYISELPGTLRTAQDTMLVVQQMNREDIRMDIGCERNGVDAMPIHYFLGEVGRLIDNDVKRNYPVS